MVISGLQKLTLLDFPGRTACTVFSGGCNLRCPFCHNAALVLEPETVAPIPESELFALLDKRKGVLDGVCITGGEPLLHDDIGELLKKIKQRGYLVKLDTNGFYPDRLRRLVDEGLVDYVAMDVKSSHGGYARAVGVPNPDMARVAESIELLLSDKVDHEFRTTVVKGIHTKDDIVGAAKMIKGAKRYFLQKFVDSGNLISGGFEAYSNEEMRQLLALAAPYVQSAGLRGVD